MQEFFERRNEEITHNLRVKTYPDGSRDFLLASRDVFRESGWEMSDKSDRIITSGDGTHSDASNDRSRRRARSVIRDLARSNDFKYFVTLTLDAAIVDRYNLGAVVKRLNVWADNRVRRRGLKYVLVPELHKDGAVHFHGFINDALRVVDSGTVRVPESKKPRKPKSRAQRDTWLADGGHVVYNVPDWTFGFSTAIKLYGEREAAIGYTLKYISKQEQKIGGRWYYSGGKLLKPTVELFDAEPDADVFERAGSFEVPEIYCRFVSWTEKAKEGTAHDG